MGDIYEYEESQVFAPGVLWVEKCVDDPSYRPINSTSLKHQRETIIYEYSSMTNSNLVQSCFMVS